MNVPELYELEYLFECVATQLDQEDIPWFYKRVFFALSRDKRTIEFELEAASGIGELRLFSEDAAVVQLALEAMTDLSIQRENGTETLVIEFGRDNNILPLRLQTRPAITLLWGTTTE